jgi:integrase
MARKATCPRYYPSRNAYFTCFQGTQHRLADGPLCDRCAALEAKGAMPRCPRCANIRHKADLRFAEIVHLAGAEDAGDDALLFALATRYLDWVKEHRKARTHHLADYYLGKFCEECGHLKVRQLKPTKVDDWLARMAQPREVDTPRGKRIRRWGRTCRLQAISNINACLNWCVKKRLIVRNPIAGVVDRPRPVHRTKDALISPEDHRRMIEAVERAPAYAPTKGGYVLWLARSYILLAKGPKDDPATLAEAKMRQAEAIRTHRAWEPFSILLRLLQHTGARPGELLHATAADWNPDLGAFVHPAKDEPEKEDGFTHKTARKGKDRVVFVSDPELREAVEYFCEKFPEGPVLRNLFGRPWTDSALCQRLDALKEKLGLNPRITAYSYRHTSITDMMLKGLSWGLIAETHGTSVEMLQKHYGHLDGHVGKMAEFWAEAKATPVAG